MGIKVLDLSVGGGLALSGASDCEDAAAALRHPSGTVRGNWLELAVDGQ